MHLDTSDLQLPKLYTIQEVAQYLRCHPNTVRSYIRSGRLRAVQPGKRTKALITSEALREFLNPGGK